jgi:hypothetical protein
MGHGSYPHRRVGAGDGMSRHSYRPRSKPLTDAELRVIGMGLRPLAHELAAEYRRLVGEDYLDRAFVQSEDSFTKRFHVPVSVRLLVRRWHFC